MKSFGKTEEAKQLAGFSPESIEDFFEKVYEEYGQAFSIEKIDGGMATIELKDGTTKQVVI
jgi:hypothetical protein